MILVRRLDENGREVGPPILMERPSGPDTVIHQQAHSQLPGPTQPQEGHANAQTRLLLQQPLEDQPTDIAQDPNAPMARLHATKLLFEKTDALTSGLLALDGGASGIPNFMTVRDYQPRIVEVHRRVTALAVRIRAEQWRFRRVQMYMDYWNPDGGRECTSRAVVRSIDAEEHQEEGDGTFEYVGPIPDEDLWGDAAEANKLSGLMDDHYGLMNKRKRRRK